MVFYKPLSHSEQPDVTNCHGLEARNPHNPHTSYDSHNLSFFDTHFSIIATSTSPKLRLELYFSYFPHLLQAFYIS